MRKLLPSFLSGNSEAASGYGTDSSPLADIGTGPQQELAKACFEEDMKALHAGMKLLFTNRMEEAETAFKGGFLTPDEKIRPPLPAYARDNRASYAFPYALAAMIRGLASLENEQLADCLTRLNTCQTICDSSADWLGNKLLRGIVALSKGIVELSMEKYARGAVSMVKGWWLLRGVEEKVDAHDGIERLEVRSLMQLACGAIEVAVSSMPPGLMKAAKFVGMKCDMAHAHELISRCYTENGMCAPVAGLFITTYLVEVKPGIGVPPTAEDLKTADDVLKWADEHYEGSFFFLIVRSDLHFHRRELDECMACIDRLAPLVQTYPAFALLVHWIRARNALLLREWCSAGEQYEKAMDIHVKVGRRSWVPCMALMAGLCYAAGGDTSRRDALWSVVMNYKAMKKSNWRAEDLQAFDVVEDYIAKPPENPDIEILFLLKRMAQLRGTPKRSAESMVADFEGRMADLQPDDAAQAWLVQAELFRIDGDIEGTIRCVEAGVSLADRVSDRMAKLGLVPELWFTKAVACVAAGRLDEARETLKEINATTMKRMPQTDQMDFDFRKNAVRQWLVKSEGEPSDDPASIEADVVYEDEDFQSADEDEETAA